MRMTDKNEEMIYDVKWSDLIDCDCVLAWVWQWVSTEIADKVCELIRITNMLKVLKVWLSPSVYVRHVAI